MDTAEKEKQGIAEKDSTVNSVEVSVEVPAPAGVGKFNDMVTVTGTSRHPTLPGKEYRVHSGHVAYLTQKGFIKKK